MSAPPEWVDLSQNVPGHGLSGDGAAPALSRLVTVSRWQRWRGQRPRWWVLHSVPMGTGYSSTDHLLGGPPGIFTITTKHHPRARVVIAEDVVTVNRYPSNYITKSVAEAERAQRLLHTALTDETNPDWAVRLQVHPVLAIIAARLIGDGLPGGVLVERPTALPALLASMPPALTNTHLTTLYELARRSTTWTRR